MSETFPVRVGANAVVVEDDRLLAVAFDDETGSHYNLPGGGVEAGERIPEALSREVREETTATVDVGDLAFVHEYEPSAHEAAYGPTHKLTLFFECDLRGGATPRLPPDPDPNQVGVEWLQTGNIDEYVLLPDLGERWRGVVEGSPERRFFDG